MFAKRILVLLSSLFVSVAMAAPNLIPAPPKLGAKAYILLDAESGKVIAEHEADMRLPPASLTKMMTSYVLSYEMAEGNVGRDDMVTISENAWAQNPLFRGSSLMWVEVGTEVSIMDLKRGIVISSGNDASLAVAEHIAGSEDAFADVMNQHAELLGLQNTNYVNSHGLPADGHYTSARDLAILAKAIINDFPDDYEMYKEREFTFNNIRQVNRNELLDSALNVDGLKTGHTEEAGYCLVTSAVKDGMRLISVVMGTDSKRQRKVESNKLLSYGFRFYETHTLYNKGESLSNAAVWSGTEAVVDLGVNKPVLLTIPRGKRKSLDAEINIDPIIKAPLKKGTALGELVIKLADEELYRAPLVALTDIEEAGFVARLWDEIKLFFYQMFDLV